jgi:hypothetical protein
VRYQRRPDGSPKTLAAGQKLHRLTRHASKVAASTFSATLAITGAAASQTGAIAAQPVAFVELDPTQQFGGTVVGTVKDGHGALIPSATVSLTNQQTAVVLYTSVNLSGEFRFEGLTPGMYNLRVEAPGFGANEIDGIYVREDFELRMDQTLEVAVIEETVEVDGSEGRTITFTGGVMVAVAPADPLIRAAQQDDLEEVTKLLAGRDVNLRDNDSHTTALEHAVRNANREMVQLLIAAGAKLELKNEAGQTVLMMLDNDATSDLVWDLINAGAKVNAKDEDGETPLMNAAQYNNLDLIKTLLDAGADVNARDKLKKTALMQAAEQGHVNIVRALVLAGADINAIDCEGKNALSFALEISNSPVTRLLRSQGATELASADVGGGNQ